MSTRCELYMLVLPLLKSLGGRGSACGGRRRRGGSGGGGLPFLQSGTGFALGVRDGVVGAGGVAMLAAGGGAALGAGGTKAGRSARMGGVDAVFSPSARGGGAASVRAPIRRPKRMPALCCRSYVRCFGGVPARANDGDLYSSCFSQRAPTARLPFALP